MIHVEREREILTWFLDILIYLIETYWKILRCTRSWSQKVGWIKFPSWLVRSLFVSRFEAAPNDTRNEIRFGFLCLESSPFVCLMYMKSFYSCQDNLPNSSSSFLLDFSLSDRFVVCSFLFSVWSVSAFASCTLLFRSFCQSLNPYSPKSSVVVIVCSSGLTTWCKSFNLWHCRI